MRRVLIGLFLLILAAGTWVVYRVGYGHGFVVAQRIGYQQQLNDALLLLMFRQQVLAEDASAPLCEIDRLAKSQLSVLAVEERSQHELTWRDILLGLSEIEEHVMRTRMPTVDQIRSKFNVRDEVQPGC